MDISTPRDGRADGGPGGLADRPGRGWRRRRHRSPAGPGKRDPAEPLERERAMAIRWAHITTHGVISLGGITLSKSIIERVPANSRSIWFRRAVARAIVYFGKHLDYRKVLANRRGMT